MWQLEHAIPKYRLAILGAAVVIVAPTTSRGQACIVQLESLAATGGGQFGYCLSLSADGRTALIGAPFESPGAAYTFRRTGSTWAQCARLVGGAGTYFGISASLSAAGDVAIVGGNCDASTNTCHGAAYVFGGGPCGWSPRATLTPTEEVGTIPGNFGWAVAISGDGNTALVGAKYDNHYVGAAYVFVYCHGVWQQQGPKLVPMCSQGINCLFGYSVALDYTGSTAVIGAVDGNDSNGAAYIFTRSPGGDCTSQTWSQSARIAGANSLGYSVAVSRDGNTAFVGAIGDNNYVGSVFVLRRVNSWTPNPNEVLRPTGGIADGRFGNSISFSGDDHYAVIGAPSGNTNSPGTLIGGAYIFASPTMGVWSQRGPKLVPNSGIGGGLFGWSVALSNVVPPSGNGLTVLAGAPIENSAYVFGADPMPPLPGDLTGDGLVDGDDIQPFVDTLLVGGTAGPAYCAADMNGDATVNGADVPLFVNALLGP